MKTYDWLIKIDRPLSPFITRLTNITNNLLAEKGVTRKIVVNYFSNEILNNEKSLFVAHNANFDLNFISAMFAKENKKLKWNNIDAIDTLTILKDRKPYPHKLSDAIQAYNLEKHAQNTHRAIDDTKATFLIFEKMCIENSDVKKYINLFGFNPKYGIKKQDMLPRIKYFRQIYNNAHKLYEYNGGYE